MNVNVKSIVSAKKIIVGILSKCLKNIADTIVIEYDEIMIAMDNLSTKKTNTIATNVTSTACSHHINIDNYYYLLSLCKTKRYNIKWKIMNFNKFVLKFVRVIISMK